MRDGHSSGTLVTRRLQRPTRTAGPGHRSRNLPALRAGSLAPSLFGLAPGGVCRAAGVAADAVRSYRTVSPLPRFDTRRTAAVCSLWHFPWARARRMLSGTACPWSPDFPPRQSLTDAPRKRGANRRTARATVRPTDAYTDGGAARWRQGGTTRGSNLITRGAMLLGRSRCASKSLRVRRVERSLMPSTRSGRK
jgi:hypothetical protein